MIAEPPFDVGAVKATFAVVELVEVAAPIVGAPGAVAAFVVMEALAEDATDDPAELFALTVNV